MDFAVKFAVFQEWFSRNILALSNDFQNSNASAVGDLPKLNDNSVQVIFTGLDEGAANESEWHLKKENGAFKQQFRHFKYQILFMKFHQEKHYS